MKKIRVGKPYNQGVINLDGRGSSITIIDYVFNIPYHLDKAITGFNHKRGTSRPTNSLFAIIEYGGNSGFIEVGNLIRGRISVPLSQTDWKHPSGEWAEPGLFGQFIADEPSRNYLDQIGVTSTHISLYRLAHIFNNEEWYLETNLFS